MISRTLFEQFITTLGRWYLDATVTVLWQVAGTWRHCVPDSQTLPRPVRSRAPPSGDRRPCYQMFLAVYSILIMKTIWSILLMDRSPLPLWIHFQFIFLLIYFYILWWHGSAITCQMFNYGTWKRVILLGDGWYCLTTGDIPKKNRLRRIYARTVHHRFWLASYERLNYSLDL